MSRTSIGSSRHAEHPLRTDLWGSPRRTIKEDMSTWRIVGRRANVSAFLSDGSRPFTPKLWQRRRKKRELDRQPRQGDCRDFEFSVLQTLAHQTLQALGLPGIYIYVLVCSTKSSPWQPWYTCTETNLSLKKRIFVNALYYVIVIIIFNYV